MLTVSDFFPMWNELPERIQTKFLRASKQRSAEKGARIEPSGENCVGLILIRSGQLRVHTVSSDGREITLYRLLERDICLFSASCMLHSINFELAIGVEKDSEYYLIPPNVFAEAMRESAAVSNYVNSIMASRFSDVMWLIDKVLWKRMDQRIAAFLRDEAALDGSPFLRLTHDAIANHLGTAREVVSRMLKYFQSEGIVKLARGSVEIINFEKLNAFAE